MDENTELRELAADIEWALCAKFRPTFLIIELHDEEDLEILVSCIAFETMSVQQRISSIFSLLFKSLGDKMEGVSIRIKALNREELDTWLGTCFDEELY